MRSKAKEQKSFCRRKSDGDPESETVSILAHLSLTSGRKYDCTIVDVQICFLECRRNSPHIELKLSPSQVVVMLASGYFVNIIVRGVNR